jgi:hypothetical protein
LCGLSRAIVMTWCAWSAVPGPEALAGQAPHILQEPVQENHRGLMADLRSFDLRDPQMLSPPGELPATEAAFNTTTTKRPRPVSLRADQAAGHRSRTSGEDGRPRRPGHTWVRHLSPPELNR